MSLAAPIRLALVITELEPGGAERALVNLATHIDRARFAPAVYSIRPRPPRGKDQLVEQLESAGIPVRFADVRSRWQAPLAVSRLKRLLAEQQPQIVQNFLFHANVLGTLAASRLGVPHVLMGVRVADPRRSRSWLERRLTRRVSQIVCVSQSVADHCLQRGFPADKLVVIPNGVDVARLQGVQPIDLAELGLPPGRRAIVFVGRLHEQKGLDDFLAGSAKVFEALTAHDLVVVGDGPQRDALHRLASHLHVADRVHFAGWRADVPAILAAADLLILPARWEGMPNVVLEAMAAGKAVVATRVEGVAELLGDAADEQLVDAGDMDSFGRRIIQVVQNAQLAANLGQQNQTRVVSQFSLQAMVQAYERLYVRLVSPA
jgi:glycosyltransferase involved in cell wall biosynthesis